MSLKTEVTLHMEKISPTLAAMYLGDNANNQRDLRPAHVNFLAAQMKQGKWSSTAEAISITDKGIIINGQHRLHAIIKADRTINNLVLRGQPEKDFHFIDTGIAARTAVDHAVISGRPYAKEIVPLIRWQRNYEHCGDPNVTPLPQHRISEYELQEWGYKNHWPQIEKAISEVKGMSKPVKHITPKIAMWCFYQMMQVDIDCGRDYMKYLLTGTGAHTPIMLLLRERIIDKVIEMRQAKSNQRSIAEEIIPMITHGWWCIRHGKDHRERMLYMSGDPYQGFTFDGLDVPQENA